MKKNIFICVCYCLLLGVFVGMGCDEGRDQSSGSLFKMVDSDHSGVNFRNTIPENELTNSFVYEYVYNGGGVATGDLNGDGLVDLYFTSNLHDNALYLNEGDLRFKDVAKEANMTGNRGWTTGVSMVDLNGDGLLDIYVCKSGPFEKKALLQNELYINQGPDEAGIPRFKESAKEYGLDIGNYSIQAAFLDFDLDGDLDLYVMNHNPQTFAFGKTEEYSPLGDMFFVNEEGKFVEKSQEVGIYGNAIAYGLGIGVGDLNQDGWPDMYISNDYDEPDYLYINKQNGSFQEVAKTATKHMSNFAMGNDIADLDNDGFPDILTLDMVSEDNYGMKTSMASMNPQKFAKNVNNGKHYQYMYNTLQRHTSFVDTAGIPYFSEVGQMAGISNTDWSWAPLMADFDNDGRKDIFITNGIKRDFRNKDFFKSMQEFRKAHADALTNPDKINSLIERTPHRAYKNYFYRNTGSLKFENTSESWLSNSPETYSNGAAYADLDNDGDLDLVVNNVDEKALILENTLNAENQHYLRIKLAGPRGNSLGLGTKIEVFSPTATQVFENYNIRGYQSSVQPGVHVGLGKTANIDSIRITWPGNEVQLIQNPQVDQILTINYQKGSPDNNERKDASNLYFYPASLGIEIAHKENDYDDYQNQVLLPHKMSQFGPAIAVADVNGDGREDIYVGQSTGEVSALYTQAANGSFSLSQTFEEDVDFEDVDAAFLDIDKDGDMDLYIASGGNEFAPNDPLYRDRLFENKRGRFFPRPDLLPQNIYSSSSRIKVEDYDGDGYPDIFVGGRHIPHHYPEAATSYLLHNKNGRFENVSASVAPDLTAIGLVTDASWIDIEGDGDKDLCVVGEWMAPVFLENIDGKFQRKNATSWEHLTGWYFSVLSQDLDGDGDEDIILGNLGENYKYKASKEEPFEVYYDDFDENGQKDLVLGYHNFGDLFPVRGRECSSQQMPEIKTLMPTYHDFGQSTIAEIYGEEKLSQALHLSAYNFQSGVLRNEGNGEFTFVAFPELAQISSINSVLLKDLKGDSRPELILAGNLFTSEIETPRNDAGYGLVIQHTDSCNFQVIPTKESGLFLPGDVKVLKQIQVRENTLLLSGNNDAPLTILGMNRSLNPQGKQQKLSAR